MSKRAKKIVLGITIPSAIAGAIVAGLLIYRNVSVKPVSVYPLEELTVTDVGGDMSVTSGSVSAEGIQKVFLSGTQSVKSVDVEEGQEVKKGDVLLSYDTTLTEIEVERARVKAGRLALDLNRAQKELDELNNAQPHSTYIVEPDYTVEYNPSETPLLLQGSGSSEDPYIYMFDEFDSITGSLLKKLLDAGAAAKSGGGESDPEAEDATSALRQAQGTDTQAQGTDTQADGTDTQSQDTDTLTQGEGAESTLSLSKGTSDISEYDAGSVYVVIINRENNATNAPITAKHGIRIDVSDGVISGIAFFEPYLPEEIENYEEQPESHEEETGSEYTQEELVQLRVKKAEEIQELKRNIALAQNEYEQKKLETSEGVVRATTDGIVTKVRSPQEAGSGNEAVVELSDGGAYFVTGTLSEFDLETVQKGDTVYVEAYSMSGDGGGSYEGEIVEISDKPASASDSFSYFSMGEGNGNVSYYPFKVKLSGDVSLRDDSYMEISYQPKSDADGGVYIMNAFIRRDGADSYVYTRSDNGLLEKRSVKIGRLLWGSYTQVKSGLKSDDYLAFPYGNDVKSGAKTTVGNTEDLYGGVTMY